MIAHLANHRPVNFVTEAGLSKPNTGHTGVGDPLPPTRRAPLSYAQQRLWFQHQLDPESPLYNVPSALRLTGPLNVGTLREALTSIVQRHEVLRTVLVAAEAEPEQVVLPPPDALPLPLVDVSLTADPDREFEAVLQREARRPFDLANDLMIRATLIRRRNAEHVLLLVLHHGAADGWSMALLYRELSEHYAAQIEGRAPELPELPVQYSDFARWERQHLGGEQLEQHLEFWRKHLAGCPKTLDLPTDRPRPATPTFQGRWTTRALPVQLRESLKSLGLRQGATHFMTLLAAFKVLLLRYTGQEDLLIGTPVGGRSQVETEPLIGLFVNTLVLRTDLSGNPTFRDLLRRVRDGTLDAYTHQECPFDRLLQDVQPDRAARRNPLVQVLFVFQNFPAPALKLPDVASSALPLSTIATGTAKFDLTFQVEENAGGLLLSAEYSTDLFADETIQRMMANFETLLEGIVARPDRRIIDLPVLSPDEHDRLVNAWNDTRLEWPDCPTVAQLFDRQVERAPERIALVTNDEVLSYSELDERSGRLARMLHGRGIGRGQRVGLCLDRGPELLVAVLGVLKSGAAYVPLDPHFPKERLRYMAEDAELAFLVSTTTHHRGFDLPHDHQFLIDVDLKLPATELVSRTPVDFPIAVAGDPAYVIYTSGSTGKPKGVVVPHGAVVNFLLSMAREPGLSGADTLLAVTTLSFDIAVLELFLPLSVGARIVLAGHEETLDGGALAALIERHEVTCLQATPVTWRLLLEAGWKPRGPFKALVGGEALPKDLARQLIEAGVELWNMYGPTETTVWSTCARISNLDDGITIGRPIANTIIRILDRNGGLCPIGVPGELCIGGAGVATGYWKRPELTDARFVPDPFGDTPAARLYRTGDLARWRGDGSLEHLGRLDHQVKVRGFRIELGEIETCLANHPAVKEAVVVARNDDGEQKQLIAYVVATDTAQDLADQLRRQARELLPEYMVPARFVRLDSLPRTPNGKVDRNALPAPAADNDSPADSAEPQTPTEEMVLEAFRSVLGRGDCGVFDNFFDLGGHSLMAARLMARLRSRSGADIPLRELFANPTPAGLAEVIDLLQWRDQAGAPDSTPGDREEIVL